MTTVPCSGVWRAHVCLQDQRSHETFRKSHAQPAGSWRARQARRDCVPSQSRLVPGMRFSRSKVKEDTPSTPERETRPRDPAEERLLSGILAQAEVAEVSQTEQMLWRAQVKGSDLVAGTEGQNEALLQQAGLPVADCLKIMRVLRTLHGEPAPPSRGGAGPSSRGVVLGVQSFKPSMKCGLIVYSATVLVVTLCVLSFYVPAVIYQLRNGRRGGVALPPRGAGGRYSLAPAGGAGGAGAGSSFQPLLAGSSVMVVTANQPLPCTTRRGDWVMGLALRNKLMYATLHGYKMWWSTELVSSWDLEAAWNKIPLLYILMHPESSLSEGIEWMLQPSTLTLTLPLPLPLNPNPSPSPKPKQASSGCCGWMTTPCSPTWSSSSPSPTTMRRESTWSSGATRSESTAPTTYRRVVACVVACVVAWRRAWRRVSYRAA
jgi:hypothetical protein